MRVAKLNNFIFEEENVTIPTVASKNYQVVISNIVQDANQNNPEASKLSLAHTEESIFILVEERQQPQL